MSFSFHSYMYKIMDMIVRYFHIMDHQGPTTLTKPIFVQHIYLLTYNYIYEGGNGTHLPDHII